MKVALDSKRWRSRRITSPGIKPIGEWQWQFQAFWLYGAVEPLTGEHFFWQFSYVDTDCCEQFLDKLATEYPDSLNILQVDNVMGCFTKLSRLRLPENVILLFQPPRCPERASHRTFMAASKSKICVGNCLTI